MPSSVSDRVSHLMGVMLLTKEGSHYFPRRFMPGPGKKMELKTKGVMFLLCALVCVVLLCIGSQTFQWCFLSNVYYQCRTTTLYWKNMVKSDLCNKVAMFSFFFSFFFFCQVTETRTGPLGCSNYDNLDSVSSVLVQSPENKIQLQGM